MGSNESSISELQTAHRNLQVALDAYRSGSIDKVLAFLAVSKAFEVLMESAWKELKRKVEEDGLEVNSPREAVRQGARLGFIKEAEKWMDCLTSRNLSVHNYFGVSETEYVETANRFLLLATRDLIHTTKNRT